MAESHPPPEDLLQILLHENPPFTSADFPIAPTAAATVANIGELVDLIFEKMYRLMERGVMSKKHLIAASIATKLWRDCGVEYIFRRQVLGNRGQLAKLAALGEYEGGKLWRLCTTLIWNGRDSCWRELGEEERWYNREDVVRNFGKINCSKITDLNLFGALGEGTETHLANLVRGMPILKRVNFTGTHMDGITQRHVVQHVVPSVTSIDAVDWRAQGFIGYGKAERVEARSGAITGFFKARVLEASAIRSFVLRLVSSKHINGCMYGLRRLKNLEELTIVMSVNEEYPMFPPPTSLRLVTVTAFTKTWCWKGACVLIGWLNEPSRWAGLESLRLEMTPMQNFGYESLSVVQQDEPWRQLGQCLRDTERFPSLHTLEVVLIMEAKGLFNWEECKERSDNCLAEQMREAEDTIGDVLDIRTGLVVKVVVGYTPS